MFEETETAVENLVRLLEPEYFEPIKFAELFLEFLVAPITTKLPIGFISKFIPRLSNDINMKLIEPFIKQDLPGFNTDVDVPEIDEGRLTWLVELEDRTKDDPVLLYSHGGAYIVGMLPLFPYAMAELYKRVGNDRLSVLMLDYTVAPDEEFPQALNEIVWSFNYLTQSSDNILLGGDSAGGHLTLSFLRHQKYKPYKHVPLAVEQNITGLMLLSPSVNLYPDPDEGSHKTNFQKDILTSELLQRSTEAYLPDESMYELPAFNQYKDPIDWRSMIPLHIFSSKGENEILRDDITKWEELAELDPSETYMDPDGIHDSAILTPFKSDVLDEAVNYFRAMGY